jgi:hypothetical protein
MKKFIAQSFFTFFAYALLIFTCISGCCKRNYTTVSEKIERIDARSSFK